MNITIYTGRNHAAYAAGRHPDESARTICFNQALSSELSGMQKEAFDADEVKPVPIDESLIWIEFRACLRFTTHS